MNRFTFKKIRSSLTLWFLLIAMIPLLSVLTITYFRQLSIIEEYSSDKLIAIRDLKVEELNNWISERTGDLLTVSVDKELTDLEYVFNKTTFNQEDVQILEKSRQILTRYLKYYPAYEELFIIDPIHAKILVSTNKLMEGKDKSTDDYFTQAMLSKEISFKDVYFCKTLLKNSMAYSVPIVCSQHNGDHFVGILVARIDLENSLYKILSNRVGLGETGETLIVNKEAVVLNEPQWHDEAQLKLKLYGEAAVNAAAGKTGITINTDYRNQNVLAAYSHIPETGWGIICKQDMHELNASSRKMLNDFIVLFIITFIIALFIIFIISKSISKPIVELNRSAQKIKTGDFSARSVSTSTNELGVLSQIFNNMADSIESKMKAQKEVNDISETMIKQTSLIEFSSSLLKHMMKITGTNISVFYILNESTSNYDHFVSFGTNKELLKTVNSNKPDDEFKNTLANKSIHLMTNISDNTILKYKILADNAIPKEIITIPVLVDGLVIALIALVNENKFNIGSSEVLRQSWHSVNVSYSNLLSNERTRVLAESLVSTIDRLELQSEKLQTQSDKLLRSSTELKLLNRELESFAYSVSHDLRAPLRAIDGFTSILLEDYVSKLDNEAKRIGSVIQDNTKKMGQLIDDLLSFSRSGRSLMKPSEIDMKNMAKAIYYEATDINIRKRINFTLDDLPAIKGDTNMMRQVWANLFSNAVKFSSHRKKASILVSFTEAENEIVYFIKDNGAGFNMEYKDKLFGVFQRLHSEKDFPGTGVGLALVHRIIKRHRGKIWAESEVDKSAAFYFSLPKK